MNALWIEIDQEVLARLQSEARAFVESPNDALRRVLALDPSEERCAPLAHHDLPDGSPDDGAKSPRAARSSRARPGQLLPLEDYEIPVLRALAERGGSALRGEVAEAVEVILADKLTPLDRTPLQGGQVRWYSRLAFVRLRAIERGEMRADSRRGVWELTPAGADRLAAVDREREG